MSYSGFDIGIGFCMGAVVRGTGRMGLGMGTGFGMGTGLDTGMGTGTDMIGLLWWL